MKTIEYSMSKEIRDLALFKELGNLVVEALSKTQSKKEVVIGMVSDELAKISLKKGIDIKGFRVIARHSDIRHSFKRHGRKTVSIKNGEIPLCPFDIMLLPEFLNISKSVKVGKIEQTIELQKKGYGIVGDIVLTLTVGKDKGKRLYIKTMYNIKRE